MKFIIFTCFLITFHVIALAHLIPGNDGEDDHYHPKSKLVSTGSRIRDVEDVEFWAKDAQLRLKTKIEESNNRIEKEAKNVIIFLGDGMGLSTITAARIFKGQQDGSKFGGEEAELHFETFPNTALSKTYCVDSQVADSACSSTAYLCGVKANIATIGVTSDVKLLNCSAQMDPKNHVSSILAWAQATGKSTGIVTTTRITHASPAGAYAHIAERDWEDDSDIKKSGVDPDTCDDIAEQLILRDPGRNINVILGGGRRNFFNSTISDPESGSGRRTDGKNLVQDWIDHKKGKNGQYIYTRDELLAIDSTKVDYILGLFSESHTAYQSDPLPRNNDPSLSEMTKVAIEILSRNPDGFFLFVEGGRIDHAHHDNFAQRAFVETLEFDKSVNLADDLTSDEDTLIVVTSDHSHVMTMNGYPERGNPILHIAGMDENPEAQPYATISYANGPGQTPFENCEPRDITNDDFDAISYQQLAMVHLESETHSGEDVIIFAKGPFSHYFSGVQQQSFIPHVMAYAACLGPGEKFCTSTIPASSANTINIAITSLIFCIFHVLV